jgi:uncharacterized protein DUF6932
MSVSAMTIPPLNRAGELPPGEHETSLAIVRRRFGRLSAQREELMRGLEEAAANLKAAGVQKIWINGSFVTSKKEPNDVDGCWGYTEKVNVGFLDPVFLAESRLPMKEKYGVEFFPAFVIEAGSRLPFPKFFQVNRDGDRKGILVVSFT